MIIYTIIALILGIVITLAYLNDDLERLKENNKISLLALKKLNLIKGIVFIISGITIISFWISMITFDIKLILVSLVLLVISIVLFLILKNKVNLSIYENKKRKMVKGKLNKPKVRNV